jgi:PAS domain S-box-containing protein
MSHAGQQTFDTPADQIFVDHAIDSFFLLDEHLKVLAVNRHACESLGYSREELIGMHPREFDVGLDDEGIERLRQQIAASETSTFETCHRRKDGTVFPVEIRSRQFEQSGRRLGVHLARDISERKRADEERLAHLWFLASMDRINRVMHGTKDVEEMMSDVLGAVLETFDCDRAYLVYPCKPADSYQVVMERARAEFPGAFTQGIASRLPDDFVPVLAEIVAAVRASNAAVAVGPGYPIAVPEAIAEQRYIKSALITAVYPKIGDPYLFGLHQCSRVRMWTAPEQRLLQEIGHRMADALTSLLMLRSLRESEKRLDEAQRIAHVGYWDRALDSGQIRLSDEACRIFGVPPGERLLDLSEWHQQWLALIHPEDRPRVAEAAALALSGGPPYDVEYRVTHAGGEVRIIHSRGEVRRDESGRPWRMFGTMQDITELRRAEHERGVSEARFRIFADHATDAFFLLDEDFRVLDVNRQACESLGYGRDELIGMRSPDFDPCVTEADLAQLKERSNAGDTPTFESSHRRKDGSVFPVEVRGRVFEQAGRRYMTTARDITERKRAEEERRASEARFRTFVDHAADAFFMTDGKLVVVDVNRQACESLGYTREELIGRHVSEFAHGLDDAVLQDLWQRTEAGETTTFEGFHRRKDGTVFPVEVRGRSLGQGGGLHMTMVRDITERKRVEEALLEARVAERTRIARELHDTLLQNFQGVLLQLRAALRFLVNEPGKAHDVLASTIDQAAEAVKDAREAVQGLRAYPDESKDLAASLARLGKELALEPGIQAPELAVMVEGAARPLRPSLRYEIFQVTAEALRNAFRHSRGTRVEVELRYEERQFRLRVRDDGRGIDSKIVAERGQGGHFGLRGMHERATLVGANLTVWSAPDSGTEIELTIPGPQVYAPARVAAPVAPAADRSS